MAREDLRVHPRSLSVRMLAIRCGFKGGLRRQRLMHVSSASVADLRPVSEQVHPCSPYTYADVHEQAHLVRKDDERGNIL